MRMASVQYAGLAFSLAGNLSNQTCEGLALPAPTITYIPLRLYWCPTFLSLSIQGHPTRLAHMSVLFFISSQLSLLCYILSALRPCLLKNMLQTASLGTNNRFKCVSQMCLLIHAVNISNTVKHS